MADTEINAPPGTQSLIVTRTIHAPRHVVYKTVTDPLLVPQWWGPSRLSTTVYKMIVMPGGSYRFLQRDKDGKEFGFHGIYHDAVFPERLVYTMEYEGTPGHVTLNIDTFEERAGNTMMTSMFIFESIEQRDQMLQWGMEEGTTESTNRLNELLAKRTYTEREVTTMAYQEGHMGNGNCIHITREFDAPIQEVWDRFTDPEKYKCWWGPKDFTTPYAKIDLRPGGKYLSSMRDPQGREYWGTGTYKEVVEPNRIVYVDSFADEYGNTVDPSYYGFTGDVPMETEVEVTFEEVNGKTRLTLEHCGYPEGDFTENTKEGWQQSLDKLEECLC